jgi:hypothetical protein
MVIFHGELLVITRWYSLFRSLIRALQMDRSQAFSGPLERMERHWEYLGITAFRTLRISNMAPDRGRSWETHRNTRIISRCLGPTKTYQKHNKTIKNHQKKHVFSGSNRDQRPPFFSHGFDGWGFDEWSWAHSSPLQPQSLTGGTQTVP